MMRALHHVLSWSAKADHSRLVVLLICLLFFVSPTWATPSLRDGDLIFQESGSSQSSAILAATGNHFTHMGIVAIKNGKTTVIEASAKVRQIPLDRWLKQGVGGKYAVYRTANLTRENAARIIAAALKYQGRPYDIYFRFGDDRIYCSELPLLAFRTVGIELGKIETLEQLNSTAPQVRALFLKRWKYHPDCRASASAETCWQIVLNQKLLTPASIAQDKQVSLLFSNF
jgi:hypothetical protein